MVKENLQNRTLSIRLSTNGFCFCSYIPSRPDSLQYSFHPADDTTSLAVNLGNAIDECKFIKRGENYTVKAIIETAAYTLVPAEHDSKQDYKLFYRYCFPKCDSNFEIAANRLAAQGLTILFGIDKEVYSILQSLGEVTYYCPASILMGYMTRKHSGEEQYMLAYIQQESITVLSAKEGRIEVANTFSTADSNDKLFYILSIWKEQGFSQTEDTLFLCGGKSVEEMQPALSRFIKNRKRINPNEEFPSTLLNKTEGIPFDLQALILCE
ncbi:MAG: DUF3822 family protein [Bacteroidaceae bacterium]|nr:DUF3822 family protein [Bacteroidaceae bacterium]